MNSNDHYISGSNTPNDWISFSKDLAPGDIPEKWEEAVTEYFLPRLQLRYLNPIETLRDHGTCEGEGFSIMTILCSLIEFLESTHQGKIYKYVSNPNDLEQNEYSSSKKMFIDFFVNQNPFNEIFNKKQAKEFYSSIRCGLLHEAATKNNWRIWADSDTGEMMCFKRKIVFRNEFELAIREFIKSYTRALRTEKTLQENFLIKWSHL